MVRGGSNAGAAVEKPAGKKKGEFTQRRRCSLLRPWGGTICSEGGLNLRRVTAGGSKKKDKNPQVVAPTPVVTKEVAAEVAPAKAAAEEAGKKKDVATAILDRKPSKNSFLVDDAVNEDHSVVAMSKEKMLELDIYQVRDGGCSEGGAGRCQIQGRGVTSESRVDSGVLILAAVLTTPRETV